MLEGRIVIGDDFLLEDARLSVAPDNAPPRDATLEHPFGAGRTALARDHWVIEATLRERAPASAGGAHTALLDWNGVPKGAIRLFEGNASDEARGVVLRYDVGREIEAANVYTFEILREA